MKKQLLSAQELASALDISLALAYKRISNMNDELEAKGYQVISGKIPIAYAKEKFYGIEFEETQNG